AGTDLSRPYIFAGFSLHDELALFVQAGLTPAEALKTATYNAAKFLGMLDRLGTVEQGKFADLLLLDANPLEVSFATIPSGFEISSIGGRTRTSSAITLPLCSTLSG